MKTFIGTGVGQPEAAVHQAVQGLTSPSAILFMASYEHFKETASRLCSCAKFLSQLLIIFDTNFRKIFSEFNTRNGGIFALRFFDI